MSALQKEKKELGKIRNRNPHSEETKVKMRESRLNYFKNK